MGPGKPRNAANATRFVIAATITLAALSATACAPNDAEVAASIEAQARPSNLPALEDVAATGTEVWRYSTDLDPSAPISLQHTGNTFVMAINDTTEGMQAVVGDASTGSIRGRFALKPGASWPQIVGTPEDPTVAAAAPAPGGAAKADSVTGWDATGAERWTRTAADLGAVPGTDLKVDRSEGPRVMVRSTSGEVGRYQDAYLWLLDADTGATVWQSGEPVRWAEAAEGVLMYTWRSDGELTQPSDRVTARSLTDGGELTTLPVPNDYGADSSKSTQCGGIASSDRLVICQWQGDDKATIIADPAGNFLGQWPSTLPPVIDQDSAVVAISGAEPDQVLTGVDAATATQIWSYSETDLREKRLNIEVARDGLMLGGIADWNLAMDSRSGQWLVAEKFDRVLPGAAMGEFVVTYQEGTVVGYSAPGVGVGVLKDNESLLFIRPS